MKFSKKDFFDNFEQIGSLQQSCTCRIVPMI